MAVPLRVNTVSTPSACNDRVSSSAPVTLAIAASPSLSSTQRTRSWMRGPAGHRLATILTREWLSCNKFCTHSPGNAGRLGIVNSAEPDDVILDLRRRYDELTHSQKRIA